MTTTTWSGARKGEKSKSKQSRPKHNNNVQTGHKIYQQQRWCLSRFRSCHARLVTCLETVVTPGKLFITFWLVDSYEAGKVVRPIRLPPRNEWGLSIDRKSKYTDVIDLANVDRIGWDRMGSDRPPKHVFRTSHYTQPQLRVITSTEFKILKKYCFLDLFTVVLLLLFWKVSYILSQ